jgi:hypothetical protein
MIGYMVVTAIWGVLFFAQSVMHSKERKDLYNRLMSRDLGEYLSIDTPKTNPKTKQNYFEKSMNQAYRAMYGKNESE